MSAQSSPVIVETMAFDVPVRAVPDGSDREAVLWPRLVFVMEAESRKIVSTELLGMSSHEDALSADRLWRELGGRPRLLMNPMAPTPSSFRAADRAARQIRDGLEAEGLPPGGCAALAAVTFDELSAYVKASVEVYNAGIDLELDIEKLPSSPIPAFGDRSERRVRALQASVDFLAPAAPPSAPVLTPRAIPHEDLTYLREMASKSMTIDGRVEMIRDAARLAFNMRAAAQDYYEISAERGHDAVGMEADDIAWSFSQAEDEAVSTLLLLICGEDADVAMLAIQRRCAGQVS